MLDLIIPVYNNKRGLYQSLMSIGTECDPKDLYVTIVDDHSDVNYDSVVAMFQQFFPIRVLRLEKNCGPGMARQYGIEHTNEDYIMFLDCGDNFVHPESMRNILAIIKSNPNVELFSWAHDSEDVRGYMEMQHSALRRLHGKVYKREFLYCHNITFCPDTSYGQEDIGFNINVELYNPVALYYDEDAVVWKYDENSLTRRNDHAFYYQKSAMGLAIAAGAAIDNAIANDVDHERIKTEIYQCMTSNYIFYLSCINRRPEFYDETYAGCLLFYVKYFKRIPQEEQDIELLKNIWYNKLVEHLSDENDPIRDKMVSFDILGWLNQLEKDSSEM